MKSLSAGVTETKVLVYNSSVSSQSSVQSLLMRLLLLVADGLRDDFAELVRVLRIMFNYCKVIKIKPQISVFKEIRQCVLSTFCYRMNKYFLTQSVPYVYLLPLPTPPPPHRKYYLYTTWICQTRFGT